MMPIMKSEDRPSRKELTHERIVRTAARIIRASGYHGTGVADIMKAAGLTHGGFYAHFPSRDALLAEASDQAGAEGVASLTQAAARAPAGEGLQALLDAYLSDAHLQQPERGCPVAALGSEMPRQSPEVRAAATRRIKELVDLIERLRPDWGQPGAHDAALATLSAMLGALLVARAVDDPRLADAVRHATREHLLQHLG
ncbi:TetR/AcrR family transcriptional regulator [Caldimonas brevitalea]|uniref:TetR family transcriptional regulator n=1 Tax=Caldimonas brevitalea TaxID=413882 RepID=A0A0G3BH39_9BURK|nr:TetR/AcrR family transcriptional regulator [Caldimonas brevitalea]AKJ26696.1 TetR family transcriptional regulator [Caldimonas brevitalea]